MATTRRSIRIADELWDAAATAAHSNGETVTDVIRRALEEYVRASVAQSPQLDEITDRLVRLGAGFTDAHYIIRSALQMLGIEAKAKFTDDDLDAIINFGDGWLAASQARH